MQYDVEIERVTPFQSQEGHGRAAVTLRCGPVVIRAKVFEKEGRRWLAMPGRMGTGPNNAEKWYDSAFFHDRLLHREVEAEVLRRYERAVFLPEEVVRAEEAWKAEPIPA